MACVFHIGLSFIGNGSCRQELCTFAPNHQSCLTRHMRYSTYSHPIYSLSLSLSLVFTPTWWHSKYYTFVSNNHPKYVFRSLALYYTTYCFFVSKTGCGWGSLTLHLIRKYPNCKITSISNSQSQREYILATAKERGNNVENITVITVRTVGWFAGMAWHGKNAMLYILRVPVFQPQRSLTHTIIKLFHVHCIYYLYII